MTEAIDNHGATRTFASRAGISALNLLVPGLGLLRLGNWRAALFFLFVGFPALALVTFGMGHFLITSYRRALLALLSLLSLSLAFYVGPIVLSWRRSRFRLPTRGWSRWYALAAVAILVLTLWNFAVPVMHQFYKPFYAPSESMAPTIAKRDRFIADMQWRGPLKRGRIVLFEGSYGIRVSRIVGIPGDRVAIRAGVPILNGEAAVQTGHGTTVFSGYEGARAAAVFIERLPGEVSTHRTLNMGESELDEMPQVVVPANHFFVLGDNRDRSADSRVPPAFGGVGMVPINSIIGRPLYIHWSSDHAKVGNRLDG